MVTNDNTVGRRRFLTAAGAAVACAGAVSTLTRSASAQSILTIRRQARGTEGPKHHRSVDSMSIPGITREKGPTVSQATSCCPC